MDADGIVKTTGFVGNPYTFTGQRLDGETGLMYYKNRYYDVDLGRFVARDPIGYRGSKGDLYEYVGSQPVYFIDPSGTGGPNDERKQDHIFVSVSEEQQQGTYDIQRWCNKKCIPISVEMTKKGAKPFVNRRRRPRRGGAIDTNPWMTPSSNALVGDMFGNIAYKSMNLEWVLTFNTNPRLCRWGRNKFRDWHATASGWVYFTDDEYGAGRDDTDSGSDFIVGNKVYMYDRPTVSIRSGKWVFNVWSESEDRKIRIDKWYYVDVSEGFYDVEKPGWVDPDDDDPGWEEPFQGGLPILPLPR